MAMLHMLLYRRFPLEGASCMLWLQVFCGRQSSRIQPDVSQGSMIGSGLS